MSAQGPPTPDEMAQELPLTPEEARVIADAMEPLQDLSGVGGSIGASLDDAPGAFLPLLGVTMENLSTQVNALSLSAETVARAIEFYVTAQTEGVEELFPPPERLVADIQRRNEPLRELLLNGPPGRE